ncbi:MAG: Hvo_1808 family surface protein [Halodesulfurarchaeum sp.]
MARHLARFAALLVLLVVLVGVGGVAALGSGIGVGELGPEAVVTALASADGGTPLSQDSNPVPNVRPTALGPSISPLVNGPDRAMDAGSRTRQAGGIDQCSWGLPDPPTDRIGWEDGCWANETLPFSADERLNRSAVRTLMARTQARLETIREREFEQEVGVKIVKRSSIVTNRSETVSWTRRTRTNLEYEALFIVNETAEAVRDPAAGYAAYYAPWNQQIVWISRSNRTVDTDEFLLAHELAHALQDDYGNPPGTDHREYRDGQMAKAAMVEGVASYLSQTYKDRCLGVWNGTCLAPEGWNPGAQAGNPGAWCSVEDPPFNIARTHLGGFPYSDGPPFVDRLIESGGWAAVERAYERLPVSTEQVIHPRKYLDDRPSSVEITDRATGGWAPVQPEGDRPVAFQLGEASLYVMFWNQWFLTDHETAIIPCRETYHTSNPYDMHDYSHPVSAGWDGDRLLPYANRATNETGYVWKLAWDSPADARQFADAYRRLLRGHGAERVGDGPVYRVPPSSGFADAFALQVRNATAIITNAPTVSDLQALRPSLADAVPDGAGPAGGSGPSTATPTSEQTNRDGTDDPSPRDGDAGITATPTGPGIALALVGVVAAVLLALGRSTG